MSSNGPCFFIIMGVAGSGKTTVGRALAAALGWEFYDGDDYHPPENIAKMAAGIPLRDADRYPWLETLRCLIASRLRDGRSFVLACSALKAGYRDVLLKDNPGGQLIYLKGDYALIRDRLLRRSGHYMKSELLDSQFEALEEPDHAFTVDIRLTVDEIVRRIITVFFKNPDESVQIERKIEFLPES
jgi:gluconokinase